MFLCYILSMKLQSLLSVFLSSFFFFAQLSIPFFMACALAAWMEVLRAPPLASPRLRTSSQAECPFHLLSTNIQVRQSVSSHCTEHFCWRLCEECKTWWQKNVKYKFEALDKSKWTIKVHKWWQCGSFGGAFQGEQWMWEWTGAATQGWQDCPSPLHSVTKDPNKADDTHIFSRTGVTDLFEPKSFSMVAQYYQRQPFCSTLVK